MNREMKVRLILSYVVLFSLGHQGSNAHSRDFKLAVLSRWLLIWSLLVKHGSLRYSLYMGVWMWTKHLCEDFPLDVLMNGHCGIDWYIWTRYRLVFVFVLQWSRPQNGALSKGTMNFNYDEHTGNVGCSIFGTPILGGHHSDAILAWERQHWKYTHRNWDTISRWLQVCLKWR
jgi:hypothetical protein